MVEVAFEKARELANRATAYLLRAGESRRVSRSAARVLLSGAIGVVLLLAACSAPATTAASAPPAVAGAVAEARQGVIQQTLSYSGELRAPGQVSIVAKAGGAIQQLPVGVGSHVTAGDVLVVLDPANAQAQVIQSQAAVSQARAKLASIQAGARDDDVAAAEATLNQQQAKLTSVQNQGRPEDMRAAQAALAAQQAKLDLMLRGGRPESIQQARDALDSALAKLSTTQKGSTAEYTTHGHCGIPGADDQPGFIDNDRSHELIARTAVAQAEAGADIVAPSDMLDGRVQAIRAGLDAVGLLDTVILSYAAKYASAFYGPFREAADSTPQFGDRRGYQMDPANGREALREVALDLAEGADMVIVKPGLPYLDVIHAVKTAHPDVPLAAYHVSGEYSMLKAAALRGWLDEKRAALEVLTSIARAGADLTITYYAKDAARWIHET